MQGNFCFKGKSIFDLASNIINNPHGTIDKNTYGEKLQKIIDKSLIKDYKKRADIDDILELINEEEEKFVYNFQYNRNEQYNEVDFNIVSDEPYYDIDGKEKGIIIMDLGSCYCRAGFRGQAMPATSFPSCVARCGDNFICGKQDNDLQKYLTYPIKNKNRGCDYPCWDDIEKLYSYIFIDQLKINPIHEIIVTTKFRNGDINDMEKMAEILFGKFDVSGLYIRDQSLLSLISSGNFNAIVVDVGYDTTKIVPIFDGAILSHAITTLSFGGNDITKEGSTTHYLPDAKVIKVDEEWAIDALINPSLIDKKEKGIGEAIINSIGKCDKDLEKVFYENIFLSGGFFDGLEETIKFKEKLIDSLNHKEKNKFKEIICPKKCTSPFLGGSVLSQLSFFGVNMYVSKEEFEENGRYNGNVIEYKFIDTI